MSESVMFFLDLMATVTSVLMLCLLFDDLSKRQSVMTIHDRFVDVFMLTGFICMMVVAGRALFTALP